MQPIHIYPVNDLEEHDLAGLNCKCAPVNHHVEESDKHLVVHNSFDGREGLELANEVLDINPTI